MSYRALVKYSIVFQWFIYLAIRIILNLTKQVKWQSLKSFFSPFIFRSSGKISNFIKKMLEHAVLCKWHQTCMLPIGTRKNVFPLLRINNVRLIGRTIHISRYLRHLACFFHNGWIWKFFRFSRKFPHSFMCTVGQVEEIIG